MRCPSCEAEMIGATCACGYAWTPEKQELPTVSPDAPARIGERLTDVNRFAREYREAHPEASWRDASIAFLKSRGQYGQLPPHLRDSEAESEAIQGERGGANDDYFETRWGVPRQRGRADR